MKTMGKINLNYKISNIGLLTGLMGGLIMIFLIYDPFRLYYIGGYLLMATLILTVYLSIFFYRKSKKSGTVENFLEKVIVGLLAYFTATLTSTIYQSFTGKFNLNNSVIEYMPIIAIHFAFALTLSLLFSIRLKKSSRE